MLPANWRGVAPDEATSNRRQQMKSPAMSRKTVGAVRQNFAPFLLKFWKLPVPPRAGGRKRAEVLNWAKLAWLGL
jgi:hypothetical protein